MVRGSGEQRRRQLAAGLQDGRIGVADNLEELQQTHAGSLTLVLSGLADDLQDALEACCRVTVDQFEVGRIELGSPVGRLGRCGGF